MKISLPEIQNKIKSAISFRAINPHNHWRNLLYVFFAIIILLVVFSLYLLYEIKNQQMFQTEVKPTETSVLINDKLFKKVNDSFAGKLIKEKEIENGIHQYKDPSI